MFGIRRREFISLLGGAAAWPMAARAQQREPMRRIGVLLNVPAHDAEAQAWLTGLRQGLEKLGWVQDRNAHMDVRSAAGRADQFPVLAKELVAKQPDVILTHAPPSTSALQRETPGWSAAAPLSQPKASSMHAGEPNVDAETFARGRIGTLAATSGLRLRASRSISMSFELSGE